MPTPTIHGRALNIFIAAFLTFIVIFSLCALISSVKDFAKASASPAWPSTEGLVISSQIQRKCKNLASYMPEILYRYTVEQQEYVGRRINFGDNLCRSKIDAERIANAYPEGKNIQVYFDPTSPENAAISVSSTESGTWSVFIVALIIFGASSPIAYYYIKLCLTSQSTGPARKAAQVR
ncbi:DUF3592 domain-containing protein [uncultured Dechloromonas sp.]|uniref:DUF3592 domain-containing protein n=1 Tax=uncultured Dechloromonas sp. TaxID=171719 RepID=UPI0025D3DC22|nr:DUF3592 domain-containing protein [uncultured Dechloromonas sp.]